MASLDVESLFTNIPLDKTSDNMINDLFLATDEVHNYEREEKNLNNFLLLQYINHLSFLMENIALRLMI